MMLVKCFPPTIYSLKIVPSNWYPNGFGKSYYTKHRHIYLLILRICAIDRLINLITFNDISNDAEIRDETETEAETTVSTHTPAKAGAGYE
ncbi:7494_t:CDS:2, partial [Rhizophagus irregularis]